jgi:enoyl-CoA hydratase/carnithine racemase
MSELTTLTYEVADAKAYITLSRPDRLNAIDDVMPGEIRAAVERANADDAVRVVVIQGAGRAFCAGYDLKRFAEADVGERWRQGPCGPRCAAWGLAIGAAPAADLDAAVEALADRIAGVPASQLALQKLMVNQAYDAMGLANTQLVATLFDGNARHSPDGRWFKDLAEREGFHAAVEWRDSGRRIPDGGGGRPPGPSPDSPSAA